MLPYADTLGNVYVPRRAEGYGIIGDAFVDLETLPESERSVWEAWLLENPVNVIEDEIALKHLPGRHPQSSHTPRLYVGGHPITSAFFNDGGSELVKDLPPDLKRTVEDALIHYGVTEEELTDLAGFSSQPSEGYTFDKLHSYFTDPDDPERQVLGLYDKRTRVVSVAPMMAYREDGEKVVLHEVGHHVANENPKYANRRAAAGFVMSQLRHKGVGPVEAIDYGLRDYSFTNDKEFLADTYLCLKAGNEVQKRNLNDAYEEIGYEEGMAGVLKELWALKHLPGRHDQKSHGRSLDSIEDARYNVDAKLVDDYNAVRSQTVSQAGFIMYGGPKRYFIQDTGKIMDISNGGHIEALSDRKAAKLLGLDDDDVATAREDSKKGALDDDIWSKVIQHNVRVFENRDSVNIETSRLDNKSLELLQGYYDSGKLGLPVGKRVVWEETGGKNVFSSVEDFLDALSIADLKRRTQFKQVLQANELISFEKNSVIQTVSVPVVISDRQAYETPWYYTDVRSEEQLVKLAGLLERWKHLPGRHDQKSHAPKSVGGIETAPDWVPNMGEYRQQAKKRIAEWRSEGMSDLDIAIDAYRWREFARRSANYSDRTSASWHWAMYEQTQEVAQKIGYKLKKTLTAKDVFDDPDLPP